MTAIAANTGNALGLITQASLAGLDLRRFECVSGCGRCCAYKVSLLEEDIRRLEATGRARDEFLDMARRPAAGFAGCMAKRNGSCVFLDGDRRCREYEHRPLYCRLYPYIRESYVELQLDVDLSCPGVGRGKRMSDTELAAIVASDSSAGDHARLLESQRTAVSVAEKMLSYRADFEPFEESVHAIRHIAEKGFGELRAFLASEAAGSPDGLLPPRDGLAYQDTAMTEQADELLKDYLVLWSLRQTLWRWADAIIAVTPVIRSRLQVMSRFLLEMSDIIAAGASAAAGAQDVAREHVLSAVRNCDSSYRTYCQGFRLER